MALYINKETCCGCGSCVASCPNHAITDDGNGEFEIIFDLCTECRICVNFCPTNSILDE